MVWNEDMKSVDPTNFLLDIPFAPDNIHMEGLTRTGNDVTWITDDQISEALFKWTGASIINHLAYKRIMFSSVCDWNVTMIAESKTAYVNQCFTTQAAFICKG
jgi:hypothetical protein